jgi:transposase
MTLAQRPSVMAPETLEVSRTPGESWDDRSRPHPHPASSNQPATVNTDQIEQEALRRAGFLVATHLLDTVALPDETLIRIYTQDHGGVERGFAFLKDPLFLASSVFLNKPERIVDLSCVMGLCLLVYRLAEHRLRQQLAATGQTIPNLVHKPTVRSTMRWVFQCFEGISAIRSLETTTE